METVSFATASSGLDADRLKYAHACLSQGMTYPAAARAAGCNEASLREALPGFGSRRQEFTPDPFDQIASILTGASPKVIRRTLALSMALLAEEEGPEAVRRAVANTLCAMPSRKVQTQGQAIRELIGQVAAEHGLTAADLVGRDRTRRVSYARQELYWRMKREFPRLSLPQIGKLVGNRDHTTVLDGLAKHEARMGAA